MENIGDLWNSIVSTFDFGGYSRMAEGVQKCIPWYLARTFVNWAAIIAGVVLLGFMIYGGYMYITSAGDPGKAENGQKTIVNGVIGFAIVVLAWSVAGLIMWLFDVKNECVSSGSSKTTMTDEQRSTSCKQSNANNKGGHVVDGVCVCTQ